MEKVSDKRRFFSGFFAAGRSEESALMVHSWPLCGQNAAGLFSFRPIAMGKYEKADFVRSKSGRFG